MARRVRRRAHPHRRGGRHQAGAPRFAVPTRPRCFERAAVLPAARTRACVSSTAPLSDALLSRGFCSLLQESTKTKHPQLLYESKLYKILQGGSACPRNLSRRSWL